MNNIDNISKLLERFIDESIIDSSGNVIWLIRKAIVARINDLRIEIHSNDHTPRHFHVSSTQRHIDARFEIDTLNLFKNSIIDRNNEKKVRNFFQTNTDLYENLKVMADNFWKQPV